MILRLKREEIGDKKENSLTISFSNLFLSFFFPNCVLEIGDLKDFGCLMVKLNGSN